MDHLSFHPISTMSEWVDPENDYAKRLTAIIVLPNGVMNETVCATIIDDGCVLLLECAWPKAMMDPQIRFNPWISNKEMPKYTVTHPEVVALYKSLKLMKTEFLVPKNEAVKSKARLQLPFEVVKNRVESTIITFSSSKEGDTSSSILLVRMFGLEETVDLAGSSLNRPTILKIQQPS